MVEGARVAVGTRRPEVLRPSGLFGDLEEEIERLWEWNWPGFARLLRRRPGRFGMAWRPSVDIYEHAGSVVVKAELPGVKKEDVEVSLRGADLILRGERKMETEVREEHVYRLERARGAFFRLLPLPFEPAPEEVAATFRDGVLEIRIPKPAEQMAQPKKITVA